MGDDGVALARLWREKRGEVEPEDLSGNLIVQLGVATEALNRRWYKRGARIPSTWLRTSSGTSTRHPRVDGDHFARPDRGQRGGVRSQVHAALVVLGGGSRREVHAAGAAQHVGGEGKVGGSR